MRHLPWRVFLNSGSKHIESAKSSNGLGVALDIGIYLGKIYPGCALVKMACSLLVCLFVHIYPPFTRKRIALLYFGRDVRNRLGVAIFEVSGPPVFHIKAGASR